MKCPKCSSKLKILSNANRHDLLHYTCRYCGAILERQERPIPLLVLLAVLISAPFEFAFLLFFGSIIESFPFLEKLVPILLFVVVFYFLMSRCNFKEIDKFGDDV
jgi:hypothetical protein